MNSFVRSVAILAGLSFGPYATAAGPAINHYFSASYYQNSTEFATTARNIAADLDNIMFTYGWTFIPYVSVEARAGLSAEKSSDTATNGTTTSATNDSIYGVFLRGSLPLSSQNITLYGLVGLSSASDTYTSTTTTNSTTTSTSYTKTGTGLSYGAGAELFGTPSTSFHVEWTKYLSATDIKSKGFVLGITHHFSMSKPW